MSDICVPPSGEPLIGQHLQLERLQPSHAAGLHDLWRDRVAYEQGFMMGTPHPNLAFSQAFVEQNIDDCQRTGRVAYVARLASDSALGSAGTVVGTSSLGDIDVTREHAHVGWTFWGHPWWGIAVNPEAKLLMLSHAFEDCGFGRVKIQTDVLNSRSRAAITKLGAVYEGVVRRDLKRADGSWRDSVVFSVLVDEWPAVKAGLERRLA